MQQEISLSLHYKEPGIAPFLAQILYQQRKGTTALPSDLGLKEHYMPLLASCFYPSDELSRLIEPVDDAHKKQLLDRDQLLQQLHATRQEECLELSSLIHQFMETEQPENKRHYASQMATIISVASLGYGHLWQDLGLKNREQLRELIHYFFPALAKKNNRNMRWKKFFYKQLCEAEGSYLCRAPSCDQCKSYAQCFITE